MASLRVQGKGAPRLNSTVLFFTLSGAAGWPGQLQIEGTPRSWTVCYEGTWSQAYYDVLTNADWKEAVSLGD